MINLHNSLPFSVSNTVNPTTLSTHLDAYDLLLKGVESLTDTLKAGDYSLLDGIAGDGGCQNRAVIHALRCNEILKELNQNQAEIARIRKSICSLKTSLKTAKPEEFRESRLKTLTSALEDNNLVLRISSVALFFLQSYFLAHTKKVNAFDPENAYVVTGKTDPKRLRDFGNISSHAANLMIQSFRKNLSEFSIYLLKELSGVLDDHDLYQRIFSEPYVVEDTIGRASIPVFWGMKSVLDLSRHHRIPVIVKAEQKVTGQQSRSENVIKFYRSSPDSQVSLPRTEALKKPTIIFEGITGRDSQSILNASSLISHISEVPVDDLILSQAAEHVQYPFPGFESRIEALKDAEKDEDRTTYQEFDAYRNSALYLGCSSQNPTRFVLNHVYVANPSHLWPYLRYPFLPGGYITHVEKSSSGRYDVSSVSKEDLRHHILSCLDTLQQEVMLQDLLLIGTGQRATPQEKEFALLCAEIFMMVSEQVRTDFLQSLYTDSSLLESFTKAVKQNVAVHSACDKGEVCLTDEQLSRERAFDTVLGQRFSHL